MTLPPFSLAGDQPIFDEFLSSIADGTRRNRGFVSHGLIRSFETDFAISVRVVAQRKIDKPADDPRRAAIPLPKNLLGICVYGPMSAGFLPLTGVGPRGGGQLEVKEGEEVRAELALASTN